MLASSKSRTSTPTPHASSRESNASGTAVEPRNSVLLVDRTLRDPPQPVQPTTSNTQPTGRTLSLPTLVSTASGSPSRPPSQSPPGTLDGGDSLSSPDSLIPRTVVSRTVSRSSIRASLARRKWRKWQPAEPRVVQEDSGPPVAEELDEDSNVSTPRIGSLPRRHVSHIFGRVTSAAPATAEGMTRERIRMRVNGGLEPFEGDTTERREDAAYDILYEHQRGAFAMGIPLFSSNSLLNFDPAAWVNARSGFPSMVDITNAVPPPGWRWDWDRWYVDMGGGFASSGAAVSGNSWPGDVDEEGWEYSGSFGKALSYWRQKREGKSGKCRSKPSKGPPTPATNSSPPLDVSPTTMDSTRREPENSANLGAVDVTHHGVGVTVKRSNVRTKWHGTHPFWNSFVRRRRWVRKRVRIPDATRAALREPQTSSPPVAGDYFSVHPAKPSRFPRDMSLDGPSHMKLATAPTGLFSMPVESPHIRISQPEPIDTIDALLAALRTASIDRERVAHVRNFFANGEKEYHRLADAIPAIMGRIVFQQSRRRILARLRERIGEAEEACQQQRGRSETDDAERHARDADHLLRAAEAADRECARLQYWSDIREMEQERERGRSKKHTEAEVDKWFQRDQDSAESENPFTDVVASVPDKGKAKVCERLTREPTWSTAKEEQDDDSDSTTTVDDGRGGATPTHATYF